MGTIEKLQQIKTFFCQSYGNKSNNKSNNQNKNIYALVLEFNYTLFNINLNNLRPDENEYDRIEFFKLEENEVQIIYKLLEKLKNKFQGGIYIISDSDKNDIIQFLKNQVFIMEGRKTNLYNKIFKENNSDINGNRIYTAKNDIEIENSLNDIEKKLNISKNNIFYFNNNINQKYIKFLNSKDYKNIFNTSIELIHKTTGEKKLIKISYDFLLNILRTIKINKINNFFLKKENIYDFYQSYNQFKTNMTRTRKNTLKIKQMQNKIKNINRFTKKRLSVPGYY